MKVIVIGAGIMGLATAWACRRRGMDVVVYEQSKVPNPAGASVDDHRQMFRASYDDDALCLLNDAAYWAWELLWRDLGESHFRQNGTLLLARTELDLASSSEASLRRLGFTYEKIRTAELARRYPHLDLFGVNFGILEPRSGTLFARRIIEALGRYLRNAGVRIIENSRIEAIDEPG